MERSLSYRQSSFKKKTNYSLPKIKNTRRVKFKNLYESTSSFYNTRQKDSQYDTTSDFYARNYDNYLIKINRRTKLYNSKLMTEEELNSLLYKLKSYYSDVIAINNKKEESLIALREALKFEQFKLNQVIEFQDIELPDEKISVKNFNELKLTKKEVEIILRNLLKEKQHLDELLKNAGEYFKTIEYMCEDEKSRLMDIKKETNIIEERINNVKKYQRIIDYNLGKDKIKNEEEKEINKKLKQDIELVDKVNMNQKTKNEKLNKLIFEKEKKVEELKKKLLQLKRLNKQQNVIYRNDIQQEIEKVKEYGEAQKKREKKCIEIIHCLYLIQKYFINEENFNRQKMQSSVEYRLLSNNKLEIDINKKRKKELIEERLPTSPVHSEKETNLNNQTDEEESKKEKNDKKKIKEEKNEEKVLKEEKEIDFEKLKEKLAKRISLKNGNFPLLLLENEEEKSEIMRPNSAKNKVHSDLIIYMNKKELKNEKEKNGGNKINDNNNIEVKKTTDVNIKRMINTFSPGKKMMKSKRRSIIATYSNYYLNTKKNILEIPSLEELKEKLETININKDILFDYNSKLTSKLYFLKTQFDHFHQKELKLEEKKSLFTKKATQVILNDYLTFKQLAKIKPKIQQFLIKNSELIEEIYTKNKKNKLKEINHQIKQTNPVSNIKNLENSKDVYQIDDQLNNNANLLISSSERIIMANKNFFLRCNDYLKQIINTIETINNSDKKENDKKKNVNNNENMNNLDPKDNKEYKDNKENKENKEKEAKNNNFSEVKIDQEFTNVFTEENEKLENLLKGMQEDITNDKKSLVDYIKDLINYSQKEEKLQEIFDLEELNNDLLYHFYKDPEGKKIKKTFLNQFQIKKFPKLKDIFNHFTIFIDPTIDNIKNIIKIINDTEKNCNLNTIINIKNNKLQKKLKDIFKTGILNSKYLVKNMNDNQENISKENKEKMNLRYLSRSQKNRIFQDIDSGTSQKDTSYSELQFMSGGRIDEDDILDNQLEKKEKKIMRKKVNSIEENIVNKLYSPFLEKTCYLRKLSRNMKGIKSMTSYNCKANHTLKKRNDEVDIITHQMLIYNNPRINPDKLADPTYNSLVKLAIKSQNPYKSEKRFKSTFTPKYKEKKENINNIKKLE